MTWLAKTSVLVVTRLAFVHELTRRHCVWLSESTLPRSKTYANKTDGIGRGSICLNGESAGNPDSVSESGIVVERFEELEADDSVGKQRNIWNAKVGKLDDPAARILGWTAGPVDDAGSQREPAAGSVCRVRNPNPYLVAPRCWVSSLKHNIPPDAIEDRRRLLKLQQNDDVVH